ncbi:MAG TPA: hypothetical protein VMI12_11145 [Puia sp.]|nr:hypothetical protein [Puia sp.]
MKIERITYQENFAHPVFGTYLPKKIGIDILINEGDRIEDCLDLAKRTVREWHRKSFGEPIPAQMGELPVIQVDRSFLKEEQLIGDIYTCEDPKVLKDSYEMIVRNKKNLQAAYDQQMKKLTS